MLEGWECLYWHAPVSHHLSHCLFPKRQLLRGITGNTRGGGIHSSVQNISENQSLFPGEDSMHTRNRPEIRLSDKDADTSNPVFYHRNSIKLNEVCPSLMWSKPCNYKVWSLKKRHLCGCLKWRHISEVYYSQSKIPDAICSHHRRVGIATVSKP